MKRGPRFYCVREKHGDLKLIFGEKPRAKKKGVTGWNYLSAQVIRLPNSWFPHLTYSSGIAELSAKLIDADVGKTAAEAAERGEG